MDLNPRRRRSLLLTAEFLLVCVLAHWLGIRLLPRLDLRGADGQEEYARLLPTVAAPPEGDWYLSYDRGSTDHHVYYHDVLGTSARVRAADFLVLGNSRAQVAFRHELMVPHLKRLGLSYYNLAFGHGEAWTFPQMLGERLDLRPAFVAINLGGSDRRRSAAAGPATGFLKPGLSKVASEVVGISRFDAFKHVYEKNLSFRLRRSIHGIYPLKSVSCFSKWIIFRSVEHGSWRMIATRPDPTPFRPAGAEEPLAAEVEAARAIAGLWRERGSRVIFTTVPTERWHPRWGRRIAAQVGVPYIEVDHAGLELVDESHLTVESARRFTRTFLEAFEAIRAEPPATAAR